MRNPDGRGARHRGQCLPGMRLLPTAAAQGGLPPCSDRRRRCSASHCIPRPRLSWTGQPLSHLARRLATDPVVVRPKVACQMLSCSKVTLWRLIGDGTLERPGWLSSTFTVFGMSAALDGSSFNGLVATRLVCRRRLLQTEVSDCMAGDGSVVLGLVISISPLGPILVFGYTQCAGGAGRRAFGEAWRLIRVDTPLSAASIHRRVPCSKPFSHYSCWPAFSRS